MPNSTPEPSETYLQLRQRILSLKPVELGLAPTAALPDVWGVIVELGYTEGSATLVSLADGTTSLHYSTGGGLLSRADYAPLAEASKALVIAGQKFVSQMSGTTDFSLPEAGHVRFLLLTYIGIVAAVATEKSLLSGAHPLSPLFQHTQDTLSQLGKLAEKKRA